MIGNSEVSECQRGSGKIAAVRTKILAYLGELKKDEFVPAMKLCRDLDLRFTTAKNTLTMLEERGFVEKLVSNNPGIVASFRLDPSAGIKNKGQGIEQDTFIPYIPPAWSDAYGKHPHAA